MAVFTPREPSNPFSLDLHNLSTSSVLGSHPLPELALKKKLRIPKVAMLG
uniref:Uncharacterized protein n=1 Tax=Rhizophora mucronata TaxID=61149 RepID=A0A2P2N890_RHIMU